MTSNDMNAEDQIDAAPPQSNGGGGCPFRHGSGGVRLSETPAVVGAGGSSPLESNATTKIDAAEDDDPNKLTRGVETTLTDAIIEASFDAMFLSDEKGTIQYVNELAVLATGYTRDELLGSNVSLIIGGEHAARHDFYMKRYLATGKSAIIGKTREGQKLLYRRKDGSEHPAELGLAEIRRKNSDGETVRQFVGFARDISERKKAEAELRRKQELAESIIEASTDAMFVVDKNSIIQMTNRAATEQFGYARDEFVGMCISRIGGHIGNDNRDGEYFLRRYLLDDTTNGSNEGGDDRVEFQAIRSDGTEFPAQLGFREVHIQAPPSDEAGTSTTDEAKEAYRSEQNEQQQNQEAEDDHQQLYCGFVHDLTEHKRVLQMQVDQAKAEALLFNMLPHAIADRLKGNPEYIADQHASVSILFADIVGFTAMSSEMSPVKLVAMLNELFSEFDRLVDAYDLNKVKTIGDCYMVTSRPDVEGYDKQRTECSEMCHFGMDMLAALRAFNKRHPQHPLDLRVGINAGPVVAGIVGTKRFLYDIWGDAVNIASRMESTGIPGRIQVTKDVVEYVGDEFVFERRGMIHCKGKGDVETFFLERRMDEEKVVKVVARRRSSVMSVGALSIDEELMNLVNDGGAPPGASHATVTRGGLRRSSMQSRSSAGDSDIGGMRSSLDMMMSAKDFLETRIEAVEKSLRSAEELENSKNSIHALEQEEESGDDAGNTCLADEGPEYDVPTKGGEGAD